MNSDNNNVTIDDRQLYKKLVKIALPISVQGVVSATLGLVDNLMVGFLGEAELAAVGIATQIYYIHYLLLFGFASGTATFYAQFFGTKDYRNIRRTIGFAISATTIVGVVFFIIGFFFTDGLLNIYSNDETLIAMARPYVRFCSVTFFFLGISSPLEMAFKATQQTKVPMVISAVVFTTNTALNYVFIFGKFGLPAMGIMGAALATTIARGMEVLIVLYFTGRKSNSFRGPVKDFFDWNKEMIVRIAKNAAPTTANELLWSIGQTMYVAAFSRIGTTAYAAYQAAAAIHSIFSFAAFSIGDATLILVGEKLGEGKLEETYILGKKLLKVGVAVGLAVGILLMICAKPLVGLFNLTDEGKYYAFMILLVYGALTWLHLYNGINITGTLRGGGDTTFAMIAESCCVWFVAVPMAFFGALVLHVPIYVAVLMVNTEELVKSILMTKRFKSKKWLNNVIGGL